jgi:hypothetical protein
MMCEVHLSKSVGWKEGGRKDIHRAKNTLISQGETHAVNEETCNNIPVGVTTMLAILYSEPLSQNHRIIRHHLQSLPLVYRLTRLKY